MRWIKAVFFAGIIFISGCGVVETATTNIYGWNLSACIGGGFDVCFELFTDNSDKIIGGFSGELP